MRPFPIRHIKSGIKEPNTSGGFVVWSLRELLMGKDMIQELHRHSFYFVIVMEEGSGEHVIDFSSYPVVDNSIHFMHPGQVHELKLNWGCKGYLLQFTDDFCSNYDTLTKQMLKKISRQNYYIPDTAAIERILSLMKTILKETTERKEKYEYAARVNLQLFFVELLRQSDSLKSITEERISYQSERLEEFRELVADNFACHKQPLWYAEKMHLSSYQLNIIIKATLGKSSSGLINDYILLEAKRYLLATSNQVNQISWHLGYDDVSYFIRFFKKHTGYSPEAYRNNFK